MKTFIANLALYALVTAGFLGFTFSKHVMAQNSDPGGAWSTCRHFTGKEIVVEGSRCPQGWMKVY